MRGASPLASMSSARSVASNSTGVVPRPYVSTVGILPSSLPAYHTDYIAGVQDATASPAPSEPPGPARTPAEQEETARRLRPHSRSQLRLDEANKRRRALRPSTLPRSRGRPLAIRHPFAKPALGGSSLHLQVASETGLCLGRDEDLRQDSWQVSHCNP